MLSENLPTFLSDIWLLPADQASWQLFPAEEVPVSQPRINCQMRVYGWKLLSSHHDTVSSNKQNHTSIWKEESATLYLRLLMQIRKRAGCLPASISRMNHIHPCLLKVLGDGPHINNGVQFLWAAYDAEVICGAAVANVSGAISAVLTSLLQNDKTGTSGYAQVNSKLWIQACKHDSASCVSKMCILYRYCSKNYT